MPVTTVAIHKGGPGKTTLAVHLAHYLAELKSSRRPGNNLVLIIDCDPQGNATQSFTDEAHGGLGASNLFIAGKLALPAETLFGNIKVIPADPGLLDVERLPLGSENAFRDNVKQLSKSFDHIVIDTPPTLGFGMLAPLVASDYAFSPVTPDPFSLRGVQSLFDRIQQVQTQYNPELRYLGLLLNRWNKRSDDQSKVVRDYQEQMSDYLVPHTISERAPISKVAFSRMPVWSVKTGAARVAAKEMRGALAWIVAQMEMQR